MAFIKYTHSGQHLMLIDNAPTGLPPATKAAASQEEAKGPTPVEPKTDTHLNGVATLQKSEIVTTPLRAGSSACQTWLQVISFESEQEDSYEGFQMAARGYFGPNAIKGLVQRLSELQLGNGNRCSIRCAGT